MPSLQDTIGNLLKHKNDKKSLFRRRKNIAYGRHTGHISIESQDGEILGKIGGLYGHNRGQIGGKNREFPNKIEGKINQNKAKAISAELLE